MVTGATLTEFLHQLCKVPSAQDRLRTVKGIYLQLLYTIHLMNGLKCNHNDLHSDNIIMQNIANLGFKNDDALSYTIGDTVRYVQSPCIPRVLDLEFANVFDDSSDHFFPNLAAMGYSGKKHKKVTKEYIPQTFSEVYDVQFMTVSFYPVWKVEPVFYAWVKSKWPAECLLERMTKKQHETLYAKLPTPKQLFCDDFFADMSKAPEKARVAAEYKS